MSCLSNRVCFLLSSVILLHEFTIIKGVFDWVYTGIRICKSFLLVKNLLYPFLDHLNFLHIRAFYLKQQFIAITVQWMPKQMISRVNCFYFYSRILSIKHALNADNGWISETWKCFFILSFLCLLAGVSHDYEQSNL